MSGWGPHRARHSARTGGPLISSWHLVERMISLIGAPGDAGANRPGACQGPQALRAAGLLLRLRSQGLEVRDCGDLQGPAYPGLDVGFLGPDIAPGVSAPVPGGPGRDEAQLCMTMTAETGRLGSLDVMELNPSLDEHRVTAGISVDLITTLLLRNPRSTPAPSSAPSAAKIA